MLRTLSPTDIAQMAGPAIYDLGFPDPLTFIAPTARDFGSRVLEHVTEHSGSLKLRYRAIVDTLQQKSSLKAPQHILTIMLRLGATELFVQKATQPTP